MKKRKGISKTLVNKHFIFNGKLIRLPVGSIMTKRPSRYGYKAMPPEPRKDNKTYINYGSSGYNKNTIRYPKKCRKTAWKRFYKLFPQLKP